MSILRILLMYTRRASIQYCLVYPNSFPAPFYYLHPSYKGFHQKKVSLPQLVQMLGEHLTNLDELVRARGTLLLSEVLTRLPTYPLDATATHFLVGFFCDRIQDYPCVAEVLKGLIALARNHVLSDNDPELVVRTCVLTYALYRSLLFFSFLFFSFFLFYLLLSPEFSKKFNHKLCLSHNAKWFWKQ